MRGREVAVGAPPARRVVGPELDGDDRDDSGGYCEEEADLDAGAIAAAATTTTTSGAVAPAVVHTLRLARGHVMSCQKGHEAAGSDGHRPHQRIPNATTYRMR